VHELHKHHAEKAHSHESHDEKDWTRLVALSTAILAAIAAVGALESGFLVNESLLRKNDQVSRLTQASDQWNYYQAEGLKSLIYQTASQSLPLGSPVAIQDRAQSQHYKEKQADLKAEAEKLTEEAKAADEASERYLSKHHIFAFSVSLCQIAIALSAVAALSKRRPIWNVGLAAGAIGAALLLYGFL
jgi:cell division protein FtsB